MRSVCLFFTLIFCLLLVSCGNEKTETANATTPNKPDTGSVQHSLHKKEIVVDTERKQRIDFSVTLLQNIRTVKVLSAIKKTDVNYPSSPELDSACNKWNMTLKQIGEVFLTSQSINGPAKHYYFYQTPCYYAGSMRINGVEMPYELNGASYFTIKDRDTAFLFGYDGKEYRKSFVLEPVEPLNK